MVNFYGPNGAVPSGGSTFGGGIPDSPIVVNATIEPIPNCWTTLEFARTYMNINDDYALMSALQTASAMVRDYLQCDYLQEVTTEFYRTKHIFRPILVKRGPINTVEAVTVYSNDKQTPIMTIPASGYNWTDNFLEVTSWGNGFSPVNFSPVNHGPIVTVQVNYDAGYTVYPTDGYESMPQALQLAVVYTAKAILYAITADPNVSGESSAGAYSQQYILATIGTIPPSAQAILKPYRRMAVW